MVVARVQELCDISQSDLFITMYLGIWVGITELKVHWLTQQN